MRKRIAIAGTVLLLVVSCAAQQAAPSPTKSSDEEKQEEKAEQKKPQKPNAATVNSHCQFSPGTATPICALSMEYLQQAAGTGDCGHDPIYISKSAQDGLAFYSTSGKTFSVHLVPAPDYKVCPGEPKPAQNGCPAKPFAVDIDPTKDSGFWFTGPVGNDVADNCYYRILITPHLRGKHRKHGKAAGDKTFDPHIIVGG